MPLLMCPNCNASMTEVKRNDVAFDMCPTCRGVWLDRGELEKIIAGARDDRAAFEQDSQQFYKDPDAYMDYGSDSRFIAKTARGECAA